jgi:hypothetical protein|tara:strand:+ start:57 stop:557 length:501 start_codon:yes stop_codon:yes gene_type:complete
MAELTLNDLFGQGKGQKSLDKPGTFGDFIPERPPTKSELKFFKENPTIAGRATEDQRITINPFSPLSKDALDAVRINERARVFMRQKKIFPRFEVTPEQLNSVVGKEGSIDAIRQTIVGRILSGDPSAGDITIEQADFADHLREIMNTEGLQSRKPKSKQDALKPK